MTHMVIYEPDRAKRPLRPIVSVRILIFATEFMDGPSRDLRP